MIELINLTKEYKGVRAVDNLSLTIEKGEFFGLLGPNGAGKSTTIGMIATLLLPGSGEIRVNGKVFNRNSTDIKRKISLVTQEYSMRLDMDMDEIMEYQGRLYFMDKKKILRKTEELLQFFELTQHREKTVRQLSGGLRRRLMVCRALLTEPEILLLDEPTAGMDAMGRKSMWDILKKLNSGGLTILLTTHYIEEAEELCDRVAMLDKGKLIRLGTPAEIAGSHENLEDAFLSAYS